MPRPLLRRLDQLTVAALALAGIAGVAGWWVVRVGGGEGVVEIDRATPLEYQFLVDVNQAEWPELAQLPDIGEVLARRIVASREVDGPFRSPEDLTRVRGIGPRRLARMNKYLAPLPDEHAIAGQ